MFKFQTYSIFHQGFYDDKPPSNFFLILPAQRDVFETFVHSLKRFDLKIHRDDLALSWCFGIPGLYATDYTKWEVSKFLDAIDRVGFYDFDSAMLLRMNDLSYFSSPRFTQGVTEIERWLNLRVRIRDYFR